jgi:hypothetical protein
MKYIVTNTEFATIDDLIATLKAAGRRLVEAQPKGKWQTDLVNANSHLTPSFL